MLRQKMNGGIGEATYDEHHKHLEFPTYVTYQYTAGAAERNGQTLVGRY